MKRVRAHEAAEPLSDRGVSQSSEAAFSVFRVRVAQTKVSPLLDNMELRSASGGDLLTRCWVNAAAGRNLNYIKALGEGLGQVCVEW